MIKWIWFRPWDWSNWILPIAALLCLAISIYHHAKVVNMKKAAKNDTGAQAALWSAHEHDRNCWIGIMIACIFFSFIVIALQCEHTFSEYVYAYATGREEAGDYELAYNAYMEIPKYHDSYSRANNLIPIITYEKGSMYMREEMWKPATEEFIKIPNYLDSNDLWEWCIYRYLQEKHPEWG